ncbi:MAG: hypothetical protein AAGC85_02475 [Bacteroidota bacterium]
MGKQFLHAGILSLGIIAFHFGYHPHYIGRQYRLYVVVVLIPLLISLWWLDKYGSSVIGEKRNFKRVAWLSLTATVLSFFFQFAAILFMHFIYGFNIDPGIHFLPALFSLSIVAPSILVGEWVHAKVKYPILVAFLFWGLCISSLRFGPNRIFTPRTQLFGFPERKGLVINPFIKEASGLAVSRANPDLLWTHNDLGNRGELFLISLKGETLATLDLDSLSHRDWEDLAIGPGPVEDKTYLYVADIGDNFNIFPRKYIHRIPEPTRSKKGEWMLHGKPETITITYPDFQYDAETMLLDPLNKDLYFITKRRSNAHIYKLSYPYSTKKPNQLDKVGTLPFFNIVSGDISSDGQEILIKTYFAVYYWKREKGEALEKTLAREPVRLPYIPEAQGEAMCWTPEGEGYYTLSEYDEKWPHLLYYKRAKRENN